MRHDIHVPNESDGFLFTSASLRARKIGPGDRVWDAALAACEILPLYVESEDPANVRVVVAEPLTAPEHNEWVSVVRSALRIPDGRLALCGGIAYVLDGDGWTEAFARIVNVPAGDYRATVYCYASAPNGRLSVERSGSDEPLGAWFRRTRAGQAMPAWLHNRCIDDPSLDPGHAREWKKAKEKSGGAVVDFLLHLEAANGSLVPAEIADGGFMEAGECRQPDPFPLGIRATIDGETHEADERPQATESAAPASVPADSGEMVAIAGGPVDVPVTRLTRVAQIAWLCHPYTHPGVRLTFPGKPPKCDFDDIEGVTLAVKGSDVQIEFDNHGQAADARAPLAAVSKALGDIPDGTVVELHSARLKTKSPLGAHRYRGTVRGGVWQIDASHPPVDAARLAEALALTEALEGGRRLTARNEQEAAEVEARVTKVLADYFGGNALQRTGAELALKRRDPDLWGHVVARVFWGRYAETWPLQNEDA